MGSGPSKFLLVLELGTPHPTRSSRANIRRNACNLRAESSPGVPANRWNCRRGPNPCWILVSFFSKSVFAIQLE